MRREVAGPEHTGDHALCVTVCNVEAYYQRALTIKEMTLGPNHPSVAISLNNMGEVLKGEGRYYKARRYYDRALSIKEKTHGREHQRVAISLNNIGDLCELQGALDEAEAHYSEALAIFEKTLGEEHPYNAYPLTGLGQCHLGRREYGRAIEPLERALEIRAESQGDPNETARTRFALARALWASGRGRGRALRLAGQARETWTEAPQGIWSDERLEAEAWLGERGE